MAINVNNTVKLQQAENGGQNTGCCAYIFWTNIENETFYCSNINVYYETK